ncbi:MAG: hypothetical protein N4A40_12860 [Tissierellales bacterium]|jgi:hypothetical protein|nr:hypothetical protein [Tissierellales bacterium]
MFTGCYNMHIVKENIEELKSLDNIVRNDFEYIDFLDVWVRDNKGEINIIFMVPGELGNLEVSLSIRDSIKDKHSHIFSIKICDVCSEKLYDLLQSKITFTSKNHEALYEENVIGLSAIKEWISAFKFCDEEVSDEEDLSNIIDFKSMNADEVRITHGERKPSRIRG